MRCSHNWKWGPISAMALALFSSSAIVKVTSGLKTRHKNMLISSSSSGWIICLGCWWILKLTLVEELEIQTSKSCHLLSLCSPLATWSRIKRVVYIGVWSQTCFSSPASPVFRPPPLPWARSPLPRVGPRPPAVRPLVRSRASWPRFGSTISWPRGLWRIFILL